MSGLGILCTPATAKNPSIMAIELYDGASGPAYVQLTDVLLNGKAELRSCGGAETGSIDKSTYGKMPKIAMAPGGILVRDSNGTLRYGTTEAALTCVVPENIKFEHNATYSAAAIADMADLQGHAVADGGSAAPAGAQPLKKGVKLVFVSAPDVERAEYMLAERTGNQDGWQKYLAKYPAAPHTDAAKKGLALLHVEAGAAALKNYEASANSASPAYSDLKQAASQQREAHTLVSDSEEEARLSTAIRKDCDALTDKAQSELKAYRTALSSSSVGYVHLQKAGVYAAAVAEVNPALPSLVKVQPEITKEVNTLDAAIHSGDSAVEQKNWDAALKAIQPYRAFVGEEPRIAHIIDASYSGYFVQAQELDATKEWQNAIVAYRNALKAKDTEEVRSALAAAEKEYVAAQDDAAAKAALEKSKTYEQQHDLIPAYEVLAGLSERQQVIVKDDLARLTPEYITAASEKAKNIAQLYDTIKGIGDEKAIETAYRYLQSAYALSADETAKQGFQLRIQSLGDELSAWFLDRAKHSLQKPLGSGTETGWAYLKEAESYRAANLEAVRDQMKMADPAHQMHSKLSIRVQFRDQTSQRQSEGFASQMESAIAAGLDTSGMPVKVIRSGETTRQDIDPDFLMAGDVLEHNVSLPPTVESIESTYLAGTHEIPSEEWNRLSRQYDAALEALHTAQSALQGAQSKGNKKAITDANSNVAAAQRKADDLRLQLDSTAKSRTEDIVRPYTYKKTTYNMINRIVLQFRLDDLFANQKGEPLQVSKEDRKQFVVTSEVKGEDTNKIRNEGTVPDKEELLNQLENIARDELIQKVRQRVVELPHKIYEDGQKREQDGYADDAGEAYMRYLNVAPADQMTERDHAKKFLRDEFNFQDFPNEPHDSPHPTPPLEQSMTQPVSASAH